MGFADYIVDRKLRGRRQINGTAFKQGMIARVRDQNALAQTEADAAFVFHPVGPPGETERAVGRLFSLGITSGNVARGLAAIGPDELRRRPHQIAEVGGALDVDPFDAAERDPAVASLKYHFEEGAKPGIAVGDPFKGLAI